MSKIGDQASTVRVENREKIPEELGNLCLKTFASIYSIALWLEMAEGWEHPEFTWIGLILLLVTIIPQINLFKFCGYIIFTSVFFISAHFPDVANHVNLILVANGCILFNAFYGTIRRDNFPSEADFYQTLVSPLRIALISVYFWAGFHKLNTAFLDPYFSCSNSMFLGILKMLQVRILGIPSSLILVAIAIAFLSQVMGTIKPSRRLWTIILGLFLIAGLGAVSLIYWQLPEWLFPAFVLATSITVLLWELGGAVIMIFPRWQVIMLIVSLLMHLILAPIGFVDFGSLAFALWLTFIPPNWQPALNRPVAIPLTKFQAPRILVYLALNVAGGLLAALKHLTPLEFNLPEIGGIIFIVAVLVVIAPLVQQLIAQPRSWQGVAVINGKIPGLSYLILFILGLYAATSYLGLRTAGNFSMFSNLRTEGTASNHLLLGSNPLKIWHYQEDTVRVIEIDDEQAKIGHKYRPLKDHSLPVVEFRKLIYHWTQAGMTVPLVFEYGDRIYQTADIVNDPRWQTTERTWEMKLMDFRLIQPDNGEPNYCRW
ncbi:MAG: hypothetical protein AAFQ41_07065 [Cyanobacteria bacterium J06623_7]